MPALGYSKAAELLGITPEQELQAQLDKQQDLHESRDTSVLHVDTQNAAEIAEASVDWLAGLAMPTTFEFMFPPVLAAAWHLLVQSVKGDLKKEPKIALGIPRGHGKTTLVKLFILYCILFTKCRFILVTSSIASMAENIVADVFDMLNEPNIQKIFGAWNAPGAVEKERENLKKFGYRGRSIIVAAIGAGGSIRGLNLKNERPDIMIFEDVQSKECSESDVQSAALERWMIGTAMKAKSPKGVLYIFTGNMFPGKNSLLKKLKTNVNWIKFISGAILHDGTALWEELRSMESLLAELDNDIAMGHPEIFFSEVLNDTEAGVNSSVDISGIKEWPWSKHEQPQGKFIIVDPSGEGKKADKTAIGYFEVFDGYPGLKDVIEEKLSPGNTVRRALLMALHTGTRCIVVEANAYQASLLYWFEEICKQLQLNGFTFVPIYTGSASKNARISTMLTGLTSPKSDLYVHSKVKSQVVAQIANWKPLKRDNEDNILDLLSYAPRVLTEYASLVLTETNLMVMEAGMTEVDDYNHAF